MRALNCCRCCGTTVPPPRCTPHTRQLSRAPEDRPMKPMLAQDQPRAMPTEQLINELQSFGVRLADPKSGGDSRRGGAGPSDHMPMTIAGATGMVPVHNAPAFESPYVVDKPDAQGRSRVSRDGAMLGEVKFQLRPKFYERSTADGIPYSKIATLHGRDVLATTILQTC